MTSYLPMNRARLWSVSKFQGTFQYVSQLSINIDVPPSGTGCAECLTTGGWWLPLRRCAACGHVGCCDNSPSQHATTHHRTTGHRVIQSFEPGEEWFFDYRTGQVGSGPALAPPDSHPVDQPVPGPAGAVPVDWQSRLHDCCSRR